MRADEVGFGNERAVVEGPFHTSVLLMKQRDDESLDPINIRSNRRRISLMHWGERCTSLDVRAPFAHHLRRRRHESCSTVSPTQARNVRRDNLDMRRPVWVSAVAAPSAHEVLICVRINLQAPAPSTPVTAPARWRGDSTPSTRRWRSQDNGLTGSSRRSSSAPSTASSASTTCARRGGPNVK